ncbi:unnamed protein product, partial [Brassica rapa subsp. trilocularis]
MSKEGLARGIGPFKPVAGRAWAEDPTSRNVAGLAGIDLRGMGSLRGNITRSLRRNSPLKKKIISSGHGFFIDGAPALSCVGIREKQRILAIWVPLLHPTSSSSFSLPPPPLSNLRRRSNFSPLVITASAVFAAPSDVNNSVPAKNGAYTSLVALDSISGNVTSFFFNIFCWFFFCE